VSAAEDDNMYINRRLHKGKHSDDDVYTLSSPKMTRKHCAEDDDGTYLVYGYVMGGGDGHFAKVNKGLIVSDAAPCADLKNDNSFYQHFAGSTGKNFGIIISRVKFPTPHRPRKRRPTQKRMLQNVARGVVYRMERLDGANQPSNLSVDESLGMNPSV
jgi:hypothetical protein